MVYRPSLQDGDGGKTLWFPALPTVLAGVYSEVAGFVLPALVPTEGQGACLVWGGKVPADMLKPAIPTAVLLC